MEIAGVKGVCRLFSGGWYYRFLSANSLLETLKGFEILLKREWIFKRKERRERKTSYYACKQISKLQTLLSAKTSAPTFLCG
ncbi:MAG: hypothetical protein ACJ75B_01195 [Flavisolibacter sp.]